MSKAAKLGMGTSFQQARPVSSRRAAIDAATAAPTEGAIPPRYLPVTAISLNPDNPRSQLGDLTDLGNSLRDHGQKTAISIMGRFAYLEGNPGRDQDLEPDTRWVVIDGNSRLAASREAGLETIKVMVDDELGSNPDEILESALVANIHRNDLDPMDEARALEKLLKVHGTQEALAARLHRSQGWVSQRLTLLKLTPELQQRLASGEETAELLRRVGGKNPEEQEAHLARLKQEREQEAAARKAAKKEGDKGPAQPAAPTGKALERVTDVDPEDSGESLAAKAPVSEPRPSASVAVAEPHPTEGSASRSAVNDVTGPAETSTDIEAPAESVPWDDGAAVMDVAIKKLDHLQRARFLVRYVQHTQSKERLATDLARAIRPENRADVVALLRGAADLLSENL